MAGTRTRQKEVSKAKITERQLQSFELRKRGLSYRAIGEEMGISYQTVRSDVKKALAIMTEELIAEAADYRSMQVNRMQDLLKVQTAIAADPNHKDYQVATDKVLKIEAMIMKLMGTEELPIQRVESTNNNAVVVEYVGLPESTEDNS